MAKRIAAIGECMLELRQPPGTGLAGVPSLTLAYGGDTLNTALYLSRLDETVDYVTALGEDELSDWLVQQWSAEGIGCSRVTRRRGAVPGIYRVQTDAHGERSFLYWRDSAPARTLFDDPVAAADLFSALQGYDALYFSGITLAIYDATARQRFTDFIAHYAALGGQVIFDGNYRPHLWRSESEARTAFEQVYAHTAIALPTLDDEKALFGDVDERAVVQRLQQWGVAEVVVKMGERGALVVAQDVRAVVPARSVAVVDTTAAGDSFNAAYLAARMRGKPPAEAAAAGHSLASVVIQHPGAVIPAAQMPP